jgi:predicted PurR-regulated permease PerM
MYDINNLGDSVTAWLIRGGPCKRLLLSKTQPIRTSSYSLPMESQAKAGSPHPSLFKHIPWEKVALWTIFLGLIYILKHFFFVIFLTFLLSYSMRILVVRISNFVFRGSQTRFLEVIVAMCCFLTLVSTLYSIGAYITPELAQQGQALAKRLGSPKHSPHAQLDGYLESTIGRWLFQQRYGDRSTEVYHEALVRFRSPEHRLDNFIRVMRNVETSFEDYLVINRPSLALPEDAQAQTAAPSLTLEEWVLRERAPQEYNRDREQYSRDWESFYLKQEFQIPGLQPLKSLSYSERESAILRFVTTSLLSEELSRSKLTAEWELARARSSIQELRRASPKETDRVFGRFFREYSREHSDDVPYDMNTYTALRDAANRGASEFQQTYLNLHPASAPDPQAEVREMEQFEAEERGKLFGEWRKGEVAGKLQSKIEEHAVAIMTKVGTAVGETIPKLLLLPMEIFTALLLSFLITIDVPRLAEGLNKLSKTRFRHVYWEIKPGLVSFGLLIGRAFQAQGVIAIVNAILTWGAIHALGIQNAAFLCFLVFLFSFIPVLGVVFSSAPIAVMALTQENGSFGLALSAIGAILGVHFIETSVLNPKILGNMLHLHPVLVLTILAICEHFFGVWGLLLGVPVFVYIIRFVILQEGIPGYIEMPRRPTDFFDDDE